MVMSTLKEVFSRQLNAQATYYLPGIQRRVSHGFCPGRADYVVRTIYKQTL